MEDGGGGGWSRRHELGGETNAPPGGLTLGGILSIKQAPPYRIQERTLLDLIRDDPSCAKESKKTWKTLREKLRFKLAGSVCTSTEPTLASHVAININNSNRTTTRNGSTQQSPTDESTWQLNAAPTTNTSRIQDTQTSRPQTDPPVDEHEPTSTDEDRGDLGDGQAGEAAAARVSLMSLLEVEGSAYMEEDDDDDQEEVVVVEEEVVVEEDGGGGYNNCCVCMVRHKGAAFIPCGHTFCRLCSRELFVQRASCPLCNNFILEILDIF